jgi:hypothetical protein
MKPPIHWDWIEEQWQLGRLSNVQIAKAHKEQFVRELDESAIRKRAREHGWQRDTSDAIKRQTRRKLAEGSTPQEVRESPSESPSVVNSVAEIIERESDAAVRITLQHRDDAEKIRRNARLIEAHVLDELALNPDGTPLKKYEAGEFKDWAGSLKIAGDLRTKAVEIERKAYSLDDLSTASEDDELLRQAASIIAARAGGPEGVRSEE